MSDRVQSAAELEAKLRLNRIASLKGSAAWADLTDELERAEERFWKRHNADMRSGKPADQRELDYMRGKFDALRALLKQPEKAARHLERAEEAETHEE